MTCADCQRYTGISSSSQPFSAGLVLSYPTCQERLLIRDTAKPQQGRTGIHVGLTPSPVWAPQSPQMEASLDPSAG